MEALVKNFLKNAISDKKTMIFYLINGIRLVGTIVEMGDDTVLIKSKTQTSGEQLVFVRHISTISEHQDNTL